jgi:hypothetical protein
VSDSEIRYSWQSDACRLRTLGGTSFRVLSLVVPASVPSRK